MARKDDKKARDPRIEPLKFTLTGTLTSTDDSAVVTGTGTQFLNELSAGDIITVGGSWDAVKGVVSIQSNTSLTVDQPYINGAAGQTVEALPSSARFDDASGAPQVCVNGQGNVGIGTTGARAQLEVFGTGAGNYYGCPVGIRVHNTQSSDAWQLVLSAEGETHQPGMLFSVVADGANQASMTISAFDGDETHQAVDMVRIDSAGFHSLNAFTLGVTEVNANYTVDPHDHHIIADGGANGITITLPHAGDCQGRALTIVKATGGNVTVDVASGDFINAATSKVISTNYNGLQLVSTGANVWIAHVLTGA